MRAWLLLGLLLGVALAHALPAHPEEPDAPHLATDADVDGHPSDAWRVMARDGTLRPWPEDCVCALDELTIHMQLHVPFRKRARQQGTRRYQLKQDEGLTLELVQQRDDGDIVAATTFIDPQEQDPSNDEWLNAIQNGGDANEADSHGPDTLECAFDQDICEPKLIGIKLPDIVSDTESFGKNQMLELQFEHATNQPNVSTKHEVDRLFAFGTYIGDELAGRWSEDGRLLSIRVLEFDTNRVKPLREFMEELVHTSLRLEKTDMRDHETEMAFVRLPFEGKARYRIEPAGQYYIKAVMTKFSSRSQILHSPSFCVRPCHESTVVLLSSIAVRDQPDAHTTEPSFFMDGIMSHGGEEAFVLPHASIRMEKIGSWSMNFWMFTAEKPSGKFRTLFFNGDGNGEHRTPSVWWHPDESRLVMRASTATKMDDGMNSKQEIPLREWVHLSFNFRNCSTGVNVSSAEVVAECVDLSKYSKPWFYAIELFVNGVLDQEILFYEPVLSNAGPFHVGKGPWTDGMKGFISNLRVYPKAVNVEEHRRRYVQERNAHENYNEGIKDETYESAMTRARKKHASEISFLVQTFLPESNQPKYHTASPEYTSAVSVGDSFEPLRLHMYESATKLLQACDPSGWDTLKESAELGHPQALFDTGAAHLYGFYKLPSECAGQKELRVSLNFSRAKEELERALHDGVWAAGLPLTLLYNVLLTRSENHNGIESGFSDGLLHLAAASGSKGAHAILGHRYNSYTPIRHNLVAYYYSHAAAHSSIAYHEHGKQPLHAMDRLYDEFKHDISIGQQGDDDELIQFQKMRADKEGDVSAMSAMGDLYYWGGRGIVRDHAKAYQYFNRAAQAGHVTSQSALAGMLLKGEGTAQDNTSAIMWYTKAAKENHTRALNGLGFIHFYGSGGLPENKTLALEYFERAASNKEDGDSVFNAGYCHEHGLGTVVNVSRAMSYYDVAAREFGHFDAVYEMGKIWNHGIDGIMERNSANALPYLKAASEAGPWAASMRYGFDRFLTNDFERAAVLYHEAEMYGYRLATSNLAYLYDQKLLDPGKLDSEQRAFKYLTQTSHDSNDKEVLVRIGDYYFYGLSGLQPDLVQAMKWYSRASLEGVEAGAFNVGHMHEYGLGVPMNLERAAKYYRRALELSPRSPEVFVVVHLAFARLKLRSWLQHTPIEAMVFRSTSDTPMYLPDPSATGSGLVSMTTLQHVVQSSSMWVTILIAFASWLWWTCSR